MYVPFNYEQLNLYDGTHIPSTVQLDSPVYSYFERALFQRALSVISLEGLPEEWSGDVRDFLYFCLFRFGYVSIFSRPEYGIVFQPCTLFGYNFYYRPTHCIITNPALVESLNLAIGSECELLKLTPDYRGIWDIIERFADKLATLDGAIDMSIINSKLAYILFAKDKAGAEALKSAIDEINAGNPAVVLDRILKWDDDNSDPFEILERTTSAQDVKIVEELLQSYRTILNDFDSEIGIPTLPAEKKERMITDEAKGRQLDAVSRSLVWIDTLNNSAEKVNAHYGLNIRAERKLAGDWRCRQWRK